MEISYDHANGIVRAKGIGFQTVEEARVSMRQFTAVTAEARSRSGRVKLLIDSTTTPVQSPEVIEEYHRHQSTVIGDHDRMAVIVSSSLAKMQMKRNFRSEKEQAFVSEKAALDWLLAN